MEGLWLRESGPPDAVSIVFLHGVGNTGAMWQRHMDALPTYHCLAPDLPGHGRSSAIRWSGRAETADLVGQIIEHQPAGRAHVVGLSLGGSIALELLEHRSALLDHCVVDGCAAVGSPLAPFMKLGVSLVSPFIRRPFVGNLVARGLGITDPAETADLVEQLGQADARSFRRAFSDAQEVRISESLVHVAVPTLLVAGEKELAHVRRSNRQLAELMPNAASLMMPSAGHGWLGVAPDIHVAMVRAWVEDRALPSELRPDRPV